MLGVDRRGLSRGDETKGEGANGKVQVDVIWWALTRVQVRRARKLHRLYF